MKIAVLCLAGLTLAGQAQEKKLVLPADNQPPVGESAGDGYVLKAGTRVPLTLMSTISTKNAAPGDTIYLQTMVPVAVRNRIVIPVGTYVMASVTKAERPGKVKGKGELYLTFNSIMLSSGTTLDLTGRPGAVDGGNPGQLNREEGKLTSDGSAVKDVVVVGSTALGGAAMGRWVGGQGRGGAIGAGAGAAAGLAGVLLTRGPDAVLERGSMVEMVLSREFRLSEEDVSGNGGSLQPGPPKGVRR